MCHALLRSMFNTDTTSLGTQLKNAVLGAVMAAALAMPATADDGPIKARLRVQQVSATAQVASVAQGAAAQSLRQILEATDTQLVNAIEQTRKFEMVPRDINAMIREQDFAQSGNVNKLDPQTAKPFLMAGVKYIGVVTVDNFQDITARMQLEGGLGKTSAERRTIQIQAVVQVVDATKATVLRSTSVRLERGAVSEALAGAAVEGRSTNALLGEVASELATRAADEIVDVIYPAQALAYNLGAITFNRTKGSGVENGQFWEVLAPGEQLVDPQTGEVLGSEEISIGWAVVVDAGSKFSKAAAIVDFGIDRGAILRRRDALPPGIDPLQRASGSASRAVEPAAAPGTARRPLPATAAPPAPAPEGHGASQPVDVASVKPVRLAIFVKNRAKNIPDERVMLLEDQITATSTAGTIEIIRREDVANAVSRFASAGANAGTNTSQAEVVDRLMSDRSSATSLAQLLGADGLIVASIGAMDTHTTAYNDGTNATQVVSTVLRCTYGILDGATGGSLASGTADAETAVRNTANLTISSDPTNALLIDAGRQIGTRIQGHYAERAVRHPTPGGGEVDVQVNVMLADMRIPVIKKVAEGQYTMTAETIDVGVLNAEVLLDGVSVGAAPGTLKMRPGLRRLRVQRPLCEPEDRMISARPGLVLVIPLRLTPEGRRSWMENADLFDKLKTGEVMREGAIAKAKGFAEFLKNSGFKINLDTSGWDALISR